MRSALRLTAFAALLYLPCIVASAGSNPGTAARVNGNEISNERFVAFYTEYQRSKGVAVGARGDQYNLFSRLRREAMDLLIEQELVCEAAEQHGVKVPDEELDATMEEIRKPFKTPESFALRLETEGFDPEGYRTHVKRMLAAKRYLDGIRMSVGEVSDEELEAYYTDNQHRLTLPEQVRIRHILLSWKPLGQPDDKKALYDLMKPILEEARSGADFAELASKYSDDSTRENGGEVGLIKRGESVPAFERAAFALQPGEVSDIVETPYGLHIIYLEERREPRLLPLDEVREALREHILNEKMEKAVADEKARLREAADIEILIPLSRDS